MWKTAGTHVKDEASTICMAMRGGYKFSLPELVAKDARLPPDNPLLSDWSFAFVNTGTPFICLVIAITFTSVTTTSYFISVFRMPNLTTQSPLSIAQVGYLSSIVALNTLIISSAKITSILNHVLGAKLVKNYGVAWSSGGLYALTWLATGLLVLILILSVVLAFKLRPPTNSTRKALERKISEYSNVY